jgi:hypothetical protein
VKIRAPSGGPTATTIWMIQILSAAEMFTPVFAPRDQARVTSAEGCRAKILHQGGTHTSASAASATGAASSARLWPT